MRKASKLIPRKSIVEKWPKPTGVHEACQYLDFAKYFKKFMQGFANMCRPLHRLLEKGRVFSLYIECQRAFSSLKEALVKAPVSTLSDFPPPFKPFDVICDASGFGVGAVLMQDGRPIAFEGRKMTPAETRYTVGEQELLAVHHALQVWR